MRKKLTVLCFLSIAPLTNAEVVLDGSLGVAGSLRGPNFQIDARLGQQVGSNLFHSFDRFNLNSRESATFTGPASINNLISRVTGGQVSHIDGLFRSTMPQANVYFINPAGVMFGPNARLDVPASLYISSADYLKLGETGRFDATTPNNSLLTVAPPSAFGFLNSTPASIGIEGSQLVLKNEEKFALRLAGIDHSVDTLGLVGGDITLKNAQLLTHGNDAYFVSVASQGEAPINPIEFTEGGFTAYGTVSLTDATTNPRYYGNVDTSGPGGGSIFIRAGHFRSNKGWLFADSWGNQPGRGITIHADGTVALENSLVTAQAYADGENFTEASGAAGQISITASDLSLTGGSQIVGTSESAGMAGNITLSTHNDLLISGSDSTGLHSSVLSDSYGSGNAGDIAISAGRLKMEAGTQMRTSTQKGLGNAGNISLKVGAVDILDGAQLTVGVGSQEHREGTGKGGTLSIEASEYVLINGNNSGLFGNLFTDTGQGGQIQVNAPAVTVENGGRIQTETVADGNAGQIVLNVDTLTLSEGGQISSSTLKGSGQGGRVEITAQQALQIQGQNTGVRTNTGGSGAGGTIDVTAPKITIKNGGSLQAVTGHDGTAITGGSGNGGQVTLRADELQLENGIILTGNFGEGKAGNLVLRLENDLQLRGEQSLIDASTQGAGAGGQLDIQARQVYLTDGGSLSTNSSSDGDAGNITLVLEETLEMQNGSSIQAATKGRGQGGRIEIVAPHSVRIQGLAFIAASTEGSGAGGQLKIQTGQLQLTDKGYLSTDSFGEGDAGSIVLTLEDSLQMQEEAKIEASTAVRGQGGLIEITAQAILINSKAFIAATTKGAGAGGNIKLQAPKIQVTDGGNLFAMNQGGQGDAGNIVISAETVQVQGKHSLIMLTTEGSGQGGHLDIQARQLQVMNGGRLLASTISDGNAGSLVLNLAETVQVVGEGSQIVASTQGAGQGGHMDIQTGQLQLTEGGLISASSDGSGDAGQIVINLAETLQMQNGSSIQSATKSSGQGGQIKIVVPHAVLIQGNAAIAASTQGTGQGGQVEIQAGQLQLTEGGRISASSDGQGDAGQIVINLAETLQMQNGSSIQSATKSSGQGGQIKIVVPDAVLIQGNAAITASTQGTGQGGQVEIKTGQLQLTEDSYITASSSGQGDAGDIVLTLGDTLQMQTHSAIKTATTEADGGNIEITAPNHFYLINSEISTSVGSGLGGGGNLTLVPQFIILDGSKIIAEAYGGPGGNINITTTGIYDSAAKSTDKVISASSQFGVDGVVVVNSPDTDVSGSLLALPKNFIRIDEQLQPSCSAQIAENLSSLAMVESEGVSNAVGDLLPSGPMLSDLSDVPTQISKTGPTPKLALLLTGCQLGRSQPSTQRTPSTVIGQDNWKNRVISEQLF